uniref:HTH_48 domain-containing protein n=1 Tax=Caenorhabditis tropicalis TaxID=1561998 RepID=A0A1I7V2P1_9PELO
MAESLKKDHHALRACFLYEFLQKNSAAETHRKICHVIGDDTLHYETVKFWFKRFKEGNYNLEDNARTGRPRLNVEVDIEEELEKEPKPSVREVASSLGLNKDTVHRRLRQSGRVPKFGQLLPHDLTVDQKNLRCDLALSLISRKRNFDWISKIVTGDEKWCFLVNHNRKRQWVKIGEAAKIDIKPEIHEKKVMLSIWWDQQGIIYRQLLPDHTTINADVYCSQIQKMAEQYHRPKCDRILLLHDNARPHTALKTRKNCRTRYRSPTTSAV